MRMRSHLIPVDLFPKPKLLFRILYCLYNRKWDQIDATSVSFLIRRCWESYAAESYHCCIVTAFRSWGEKKIFGRAEISWPMLDVNKTAIHTVVYFIISLSICVQFTYSSDYSCICFSGIWKLLWFSDHASVFIFVLIKSS